MSVFHRIPVEREEVRIKAEFAEDSEELLQILGTARSQESLTGYPQINHNGRRWLLVTQEHRFAEKKVCLELLRLEE